MQKTKFWQWLAAGALCSMSVAQAGPFSAMYVFGDSLSDTGNVFLATGGTVPSAPYFNGRFSDGPIWVDTVAAGLGLPSGAIPSLAGGNNYAFGGARTGAGASPVPGILAQVGGLWAPSHPGGADPNALYIVVGGGNDMRDARTAFQTNSAADQAGRAAAAAAATTNILNSVLALASAGARNVLLMNLPDLGFTPEAIALGLSAASTDASQQYNAMFGSIESLAEGLVAGLDVRTFDLHGLFNSIRADAISNGGNIYGITNVSTPCGTFPGSIGVSCNVSMFSDALHPSSRASTLLGSSVLSFLQTSSVPEPSTLALLALAFVLLAYRRRQTIRH
jgi:outer membrane lipase/esterase